MGEKINVKEIVKRKKEELKVEVDALKSKGINPKLAVILASEDEASKIYVGKKRKMCEEMGILQEEFILDNTVQTQDVVDIIEKLNEDKSVSGILVQLPLFKHLDMDRILDSISYKKDVDGFHPLTLGKLFIGEDETFISCTPKGIMTILDDIGTEYEGKHAVVVGRSRIVGKPISQLLLKRGATVTICHSKTKDISSFTRQADILVAAVGRAHIITKDMIKPGAIVVDVGINRIDGKILGDVDTENALEVCDKITPVPGGVGLTTVLSLLENVVQAAKEQNNI
ncbi:MAG: bifunctional 5,10-methylenetetrahydrofolate dehydrogenase/5,10-methenyltetrahydrofolate cyclohydrolase [Clostridia bacterium]|nr:bifunctional 5,10-methylenetetrahydrofolate dehydrogenase/5,10-methenyltetrahydrofolate cyclohydrolase [Clostridia bacterium]